MAQPDLTADQIAEILEMQPHPEGGHYVETWRHGAPEGERGQVLLPEGGAGGAVDAALRIFSIRRMISLAGDAVAVDPSAAPLLAFYAAPVLQASAARDSVAENAVAP